MNPALIVAMVVGAFGLGLTMAGSFGFGPGMIVGAAIGAGWLLATGRVR